MRTTLVRHVSVVALLGGLVALMALPSCQTKNCEGGPIVEFGNLPGQGYWADANTWVSSAHNATEWLDYGPQRLYFFDPPGFTDFDQRKLTSALIYISPTQDPNQFGDNFSLASGNSAVITYIQTVPSKIKGGIYVKNDTCSRYFMRAVFTVEPNPVVPPVDVDAGADASTEEDGSMDAAGDAADAATD